MLNTAELKALLHARYNKNGWVFLDEVPSATGFTGHGKRICDAVVMGVWPSNGLELHGFEIKSSRSDFLNELRNPDKAGSFKQFCDRWWLVVSSKNIVGNDLPPDWGLMYPKGKKLVVNRGAPLLEQPKAIDRVLLASLLCKTASQSPSKAILNIEYQRGLDGAERFATPGDAELAIKFQKVIFEFEKASGVSLRSWNAGEIGKAVKVVLSLRGDHGSVEVLKGLCRKVAKQSVALEESMVELRRVGKSL